MTQRTLSRSLAVVVALAALSTLVFAQDCQISSSGGLQRQPTSAVIHPENPGR